jgi:hypothetical protein
MKRFLSATTVVMIGLIVAVCMAEDSSVDKYLKDLKSKDPEIRATAAFELGCG